MTRITAPTTAETADLVTVADGQPITTTERVAAAAGLQHKNVLALVREHLADFDAFGPVAFETRLGSPLRQGGYGASTQYAILTDPQAALLLTYLRNTAKVRALKVRLIREFVRIAAELARRRAAAPPPVPALPTTYLDAMRELVITLEASQRTTRALAAAETRIADQAPAVAAQARLATASGELCIRDAAKSLDIKPGALFERLASLNWIYRHRRDDGSTGPWRARQTQIDAGRLRHRLATYTGRDGGERRTDQVTVTPRGLAKLGELLAGGTP